MYSMINRYNLRQNEVFVCMYYNDETKVFDAVMYVSEQSKDRLCIEPPMALAEARGFRTQHSAICDLTDKINLLTAGLGRFATMRQHEGK